MRLSIVIPALNEAAQIARTLTPLQAMRLDDVELIVVDGGSVDDTQTQAAPLTDRVLTAAPGRAKQMNAGAAAASGEALLFLHADSRLPVDAPARIREALAAGRQWGRFDVRIEGRHRLLPVIAWFMNRRSRATGICTGDQGIFVSREVFDRVGGFPDQPLMEDVEMTTRLKRLGPPACLRERIVTSGRRWEKHGALRTIALMWRLRFQYWMGANPADLHRAYYGK